MDWFSLPTKTKTTTTTNNKQHGFIHSTASNSLLFLIDSFDHDFKNIVLEALLGGCCGAVRCVAIVCSLDLSRSRSSKQQ